MAQTEEKDLASATDSITELVGRQDKAMQKLFTKALNIYVSPVQRDKDEKVKLEQLRKEIDESIK